MLDQDGYHNLGVAARRQTDEPSIVDEGALGFASQAAQGVEADNLRRAGLAGHINARQAGHRAGAGFVDHAPESVGENSDGVGLQRDPPALRLFVGEQHPGTRKHSPGGDAPQRIGELQGSNCYRSLPDGHRDGLAQPPGLLADTLLPLRRGHQPLLFAGQVNAGGAAQAKAAGVARDALDAEPFADFVKKDVAGLHNRPVQAHGAVALRAPAAEGPVVVAGPAGALHGKGAVEETFFQRGGGDDDFENRSRSELRLRGAVQDGLVGVLGE